MNEKIEFLSAVLLISKILNNLLHSIEMSLVYQSKTNNMVIPKNIMAVNLEIYILQFTLSATLMALAPAPAQ